MCGSNALHAVHLCTVFYGLAYLHSDFFADGDDYTIKIRESPPFSMAKFSLSNSYAKY